jgi:hypothetical protein
VVPLLAKVWSHAAGGTHLKVVPCCWRATSSASRGHRVHEGELRLRRSRQKSGPRASELELVSAKGCVRDPGQPGTVVAEHHRRDIAPPLMSASPTADVRRGDDEQPRQLRPARPRPGFRYPRRSRRVDCVDARTVPATAHGEAPGEQAPVWPVQRHNVGDVTGEQPAACHPRRDTCHAKGHGPFPEHQPTAAPARESSSREAAVSMKVAAMQEPPETADRKSAAWGPQSSPRRSCRPWSVPNANEAERSPPPERQIPSPSGSPVDRSQGRDTARSLAETKPGMRHWPLDEGAYTGAPR